VGEPSLLILAGVAAIILGLIPAVIASQKGYSIRLWWMFGTLLFPFTLPMALFLPTTAKAVRIRQCDLAWELTFRERPSCYDDVRIEAITCPYCKCGLAPLN
jgi:hypothetical protein